MRRPIKPILGAVTLVSVAPILFMLASSATASLLGCPLDEGGRHPCLLAGVDIGETLHVGFVSAWFMFLTWPLALLCAALWALLFARWGVRRLLGRVRPA